MVVLIVDSSTHIIQRLEELLSELNFIKSIYTADSHTNARHLFTKYQPRIVLLGINIPENESLKLLAEIAAGSCKTFVIVLSLTSNDYINGQYSLSGANYLLDKYEDFDKIPGIIAGIAGEDYKLQENH